MLNEDIVNEPANIVTEKSMTDNKATEIVEKQEQNENKLKIIQKKKLLMLLKIKLLILHKKKLLILPKKKVVNAQVKKEVVNPHREDVKSISHSEVINEEVVRVLMNRKC